MTDIVPGSKPLPLYQCHKQVRALKIKSISDVSSTFDEASQKMMTVRWIIPEDSNYPSIPVSCANHVAKHNPQPGGYHVEYEDGYKSYSPAKAFEEGYSPVSETMTDISKAVESTSSFDCFVKALPKGMQQTIKESAQRGESLTQAAFTVGSKSQDKEIEALQVKAKLYEHLVTWLINENLLHAQFCKPSQDAQTADWWILRKAYMVSGDGCEGYGKSPEQAVENAFKDW